MGCRRGMFALYTTPAWDCNQYFTLCERALDWRVKNVLIYKILGCFVLIECFKQVNRFLFWFFFGFFHFWFCSLSRHTKIWMVEAFILTSEGSVCVCKKASTYLGTYQGLVFWEGENILSPSFLLFLSILLHTVSDKWLLTRSLGGAVWQAREKLPFEM